MIFRQLFDATSSTYTYLLADRGQALLLDPVADHIPAYLQLLRELDLRLQRALDSHVHADHITALGELRKQTGCESSIGAQARTECASSRIRDGEHIGIGGVALRALYTPGHTDDSYSFVLENGDVPRVFTGDTLLIRGTGRTDFQNGDARQQYDSLFNKLLKLPGDTAVYPAHDYKGWTSSSIDEERRHNPRLQIGSVEEYIALMNSLHLPDPKLMDIAIPANLACGVIS
ncbi:MAG TPA: MBL fold metallo-hydrolase [Stenotrophobium sp.]|nr:MBL fold metallo-hydrolase [Stenotrophobium sp.]